MKKPRKLSWVERRPKRKDIELFPVKTAVSITSRLQGFYTSLLCFGRYGVSEGQCRYAAACLADLRVAPALLGGLVLRLGEEARDELLDQLLIFTAIRCGRAANALLEHREHPKTPILASPYEKLNNIKQVLS